MAEDTSTIQGKELRNTVILGITFCAAFTAYGSIEKLQSSLNEEDNLGVVSLSVVYGTFIFTGFLAPTVIKFLGVKNTVILSWFVHLLYTASNFYPEYRTLIPSSVLLGCVSALLWTSQSTYVTACAYSLAKHTSQTPYATLSKLLGIFFAIEEFSGVIGNLISSLVLQQGTKNQTEEGLCGASFCPGDVNRTTIEQPETETVYILLGIYVGFDLIALVITIVFLSPLPKSSWANTTSLKESLVSFFVTLFTTKLIFLVPFMMYLAMELSFFTGDFIRAYISCPIGIHMVGFVLVGASAAVSIFNFIFGRIAKCSGRYVLIGGAALVKGGQLVFCYQWSPSEDDEVLIFLLPLMSGLADAVWLSQGQAVIALFFSEQKEPAFANYHAWKSVGSTVTFALSSILCIKSTLLTLLITLSVAMVLYTGVEMHYKLTNQKLKQPEYDPLT